MPTPFARRLVSTAVMALASLCVLPGHAHAQCQYDVTVLQFPIDCGIGTVITAGLSLNENGAVVGRYKCPVSKYSQGFLWTAEGGFVGLDPPPGVIEVIPTDINHQGVICGTMIVADIGFRGFVYDHGVWTVLPPRIFQDIRDSHLFTSPRDIRDRYSEYSNIRIFGTVTYLHPR